MYPVICSRWPGTNLKLELGVLLLLQRFAELLLDPHDHQLHLDPDGVLVGLTVCLINKWLQVSDRATLKFPPSLFVVLPSH